MSEKKKKRNLTFFGLSPSSPSQPIIRRTIKIAKVLVLKIMLLQAAHSFFACQKNFFPPHCFSHHQRLRSCSSSTFCVRSIEPPLDRIKNNNLNLFAIAKSATRNSRARNYKYTRAESREKIFGPRKSCDGLTEEKEAIKSIRPGNEPVGRSSFSTFFTPRLTLPSIAIARLSSARDPNIRSGEQRP